MAQSSSNVKLVAAAAAAGGPLSELPPGFRFFPTDEELVMQYLRRKALSIPLPADIIHVVELLAYHPSDLLGARNEEKYFFTHREPKYVKGTRVNRATRTGYWKATGNERGVFAAHRGADGNLILVGMKRTLVFYLGKPPGGERTDFVMNEYRLSGAGLAPCRFAAPPQRNTTTTNQLGQCVQNVAAPAAPPAPVIVHPSLAWVLCRIGMKKRGNSAVPAMVLYEDNNNAEVNNNANAGIQFIDFLGQAEAGARRAISPMSSCLTDDASEDGDMEEEEEEEEDE